jgi:hypothetical protein
VHRSSGRRTVDDLHRLAVGLATGVLPLQLLGQLVNIGTCWRSCWSARRVDPARHAA